MELKQGYRGFNKFLMSGSKHTFKANKSVSPVATRNFQKIVNENVGAFQKNPLEKKTVDNYIDFKSNIRFVEAQKNRYGGIQEKKVALYGPYTRDDPTKDASYMYM